MLTYGYARAPTWVLDYYDQIKLLKEAGCSIIVKEKGRGSGLKARPELVKMMRRLQKGDVVVVCKLDKLGRSTRELLELIEHVSACGAFFKSLGDPLFDTTSPTGKLLSTLLAAIVEFERSMIIQRTSEGRERAMKRGVKFGRKSKLTAHQRKEALERLLRGESKADIARSYNIDRPRISRLATRFNLSS